MKAKYPLHVTVDDDGSVFLTRNRYGVIVLPDEMEAVMEALTASIKAREAVTA